MARGRLRVGHGHCNCVGCSGVGQGELQQRPTDDGNSRNRSIVPRQAPGGVQGAPVQHLRASQRERRTIEARDSRFEARGVVRQIQDEVASKLLGGAGAAGACLG